MESKEALFSLGKPGKLLQLQCSLLLAFPVKKKNMELNHQQAHDSEG